MMCHELIVEDRFLVVSQEAVYIFVKTFAQK